MKKLSIESRDPGDDDRMHDERVSVINVVEMPSRNGRSAGASAHQNISADARLIYMLNTS